MKTQVLKKPSFEKMYTDKELFLSASEIQAYLELPENKQHDYLSGRYVLKQCFTSTVNGAVDMSKFSISYEDYKPKIIYRGKTYNCSISHSNKHVACAVDESESIGIDVEEMHARTTEFQDYILSKDEAEYFHKNEELISTRAWSIKEAAFKADGVQSPTYDYVLIGRNQDFFLVQNSKTSWQVEVVNRVIDNYTVSYTIPNTV